jgi:ABC-type antimicrobial peptide transport system permease subunit
MREIARIDPTLPVLEASSVERHMKLVLFEEHRDAAIAAGVALLALVLSGVGIYAVVSLVTSTRTREIGIRMALGARRNDILRLVVGRGLRLASLGAALGAAGSFAVSRLLESRLHGVAPGDPVAFAAAAGLVLAIAVAATLLPALRASRLDPSRTLQSS